MYSRFMQFSQKIEAFLNPAPFRISSHCCDIWERTILNKIGSVETQPEKCKFGPEGETKMFLLVKGIAPEDAEHLFQLLKEKDETATKEPISSLEESSESDDDEFDECYDYRFVIDLEMVDDYLYPLFVAEVTAMSVHRSEQFQLYQALSKKDKGVEFYQLLDDIVVQAGELENGFRHDFTKGQLNIIFRLLNNSLISYKEHLQHGCGKFTDEVVSGTQLFDEIYGENNQLNENDSAINLKQNLTMLRNTMPKPLPKVIELFSLFGSPSVGPNSPVSPNPNDTELKADTKEERRSCCQIL